MEAPIITPPTRRHSSMVQADRSKVTRARFERWLPPLRAHCCSEFMCQSGVVRGRYGHFARTFVSPLWRC